MTFRDTCTTSSGSGLILVFSEDKYTAHLLFDRCISWEPTDRPSITSVLQQLSEVKGQDDLTVQFDHTGSLGHVILDFNDTDQAILDFLVNYSTCTL